MSLALCKALTALSLWKSSTARGLSSSLVRVKDANLINKPTEKPSLADKEKEAKQRQAVYHRKSYQQLKESPEWLERRRAVKRDWLAKLRNDPERYAEYLERARQVQAAAYRDLAWRDHHAISTRCYRLKRAKDPSFRKARQQADRVHQFKRAVDSYPDLHARQGTPDLRYLWQLQDRRS